MSSAAATVVLVPAVDALMKKIKRNLINKQGDLAFLHLTQALNVTSDVSSTTIPITTAKEVIRQVSGVALTDSEVNTLLAWLDRNGDRIITPTELLAALRAQSTPLRRSMVARVWESCCENNTAFDAKTASIPVDALLGQFDASCHPFVLQGKASQEDIEAQANDFFSNAAAIASCGRVTRGLGLEAFFATIGGDIPVDADFAAMLAACWHLPGFDHAIACDRLQSDDAQRHNAPALQAGMTVDAKASVLLTMTLERALDEMIAHHRKSLRVSSAPRAAYRNLGCGLRSADREGTGFVPRKTFVEVLEATSRLYIAYEPVLDLFDRNLDHTVDYRHYLAALVGELAPSRKLCAERLWQQFPRDRRNCVSVAEIHQRFLGNNAKQQDQLQKAANGASQVSANPIKIPGSTKATKINHPEVIAQQQQVQGSLSTQSSSSSSSNTSNTNSSSGGQQQQQLTAAGELALFLDSWDMRKQHGVVSSFELLCEWFVPLSSSIEQDSYFVEYLKKQWGLQE